MRHPIPSILLTTSLALAAGAQAQTGFLHVAEPSNTFLHVTQLDNGAINGDPSARLIVTPHWNPGGAPFGVSNPHPIGVFYSSGRWNIFNEDLAGIPEEAAFNVLVAPPSRSFVHVATAGNTSAAGTILDHPLLGMGDTQFFVTHNRSPDGEPLGPSVDFLFRSLFFFNPNPTWSIEGPLGESLPVGAEFNIFVADGSFPTFDHRTGPGNTTFDVTHLDHPSLNGHPAARVWAYEHVPSGPATDNDHPIAVAYDPFQQMWALLNTDGADFPDDARFVVGFLPAQIFADGFESGDTSLWSSTVP